MAKKKKKLKLLKKKKSNTAVVEKTIGGGGAHSHAISHQNPENTEMDGGHTHLFIIGGLPVETMWDGVHVHPVNAIASRTGPEDRSHNHIVKIAGTKHQTSEGGTHIHELAYVSDHFSETNHSGIHRHVITIDEVEYQSLLPGDLLQSDIRKRVAIEIQSVHVSNLLFPDAQEAIQFIEDRGFVGRDVQKLDDGFRFRQLSRDRFQQSTLKELELSNGVIAIVGVLDPEMMSAENNTLDSLKDINPTEEIMREEQVAALSRLKDAYSGMVVDMKAKAEKFIPILNQFVDLSDEFVKNEPFQVFLTEFIDSFNVLQSEIERIDTPEGQMTSQKRVNINFEDHIRDLESDIEKMTDLFYESEGYDNFGRLLKKNHMLFKQMILNIPLIRAEGSGTPISKVYNDFIDFEILKTEELDHLSKKDIANLKIKEIDIDKLKGSPSLDKTLKAFLKKLVGTSDNVVVEFGPRTIDGAIGIDKQRSELADICYDLDNGIPLPADSVDKVFSKCSIQLLSDREQIIKEASRVLKNAGEFIIEAPSTDGRNAFIPCNKSLWNEEVFKYFTEGENPQFEMVESSTELADDKSSAIVKVKLTRRDRS